MCTSTALLSTSSPEPVQALLDLGARQDGAGALHEQLQQRELARRQRDLRAVAGDAVRGRVEHHAQVLDERRRAAGAAPQQRADARGQLVQVEGLDEVVVGAGIETLRPGPRPHRAR